MEPGVMKFQYEHIVKQLLLLQDHAAGRTCPYTPTGEMCIRKHLLTVEAYAQETLPMEEMPAFKERLENLLVEARNYRLNQEKVLCGETEQFLEGLERWARVQRKDFETHSLTCEMEKAMKEAELSGMRE